MLPSTAYQWGRFARRFDVYRASQPASTPVEALVQSWLATLPRSQQGTAKTALRAALGRQAMDWPGIETARYRRNESNLLASVLREDDRATLRAVITGPRDRALLECLWTLRRAEVANLVWGDVDFGRGMVHVRRGKGGKPSWTLLPAEAQAALTDWYNRTREALPTAPVFPTPPRAGRQGQPGHYRPEGLGRVVQRLLTQAGLWHKGAGCAHRFRRSFATEYLRANPQDLAGLQRLMRHENPTTTAGYIFYQPDDLAPRLAKVRL